MSVQAQIGKPASASVPAPIGLLAELTHRCPLQCPYCSNPLELERVGGELPTESLARRVEPRRLRWVCCRSIFPAASPPYAAIWRRSSPGPLRRGCIPT